MDVKIVTRYAVEHEMLPQIFYSEKELLFLRESTNQKQNYSELRGESQ